MTYEQAEELFDAIYAPYRVIPENKHAKPMLKYLMRVPYESTREAIDIAVANCRFPPTIADIEKARRQIGEAKRYQAPSQIRVNIYDVWRQQRITHLSDTAYLQYIADRAAGNDGIWEARWQDEFRRGEPPQGGKPKRHAKEQKTSEYVEVSTPNALHGKRDKQHGEERHSNAGGGGPGIWDTPF